MFPLRNFVALSASWFVPLCALQAQTPATGLVTIRGSLQGAIYPCGNTSCPTYDSGQIQIVVNGYIATASYSPTTGQKTSEQLARALAAKLNTAASPVAAVTARAAITVTSKLKGTPSNYPLSTLVTKSTQFTRASFSASTSGPTLTGGTGAPVPVSTLARQTSNNTTVCSSSNDPASNLPYCSTFFNGFNTSPANTGAQTLIMNPPAGHVSNVSVKQLLSSGWTGRLICEYQPWFGQSGHKSVGYNENFRGMRY
jgi:hypothetical protein